jgi:hypothetical protein
MACYSARNLIPYFHLNYLTRPQPRTCELLRDITAPQSTNSSYEVLWNPVTNSVFLTSVPGIYPIALAITDKTINNW